MNDTALLLADRKDEFYQHWSVVAFLETRAGESLGIEGGGTLERRHVAISKAGLLVHLYNIIEAVMSSQLREVMENIAQHSPAAYQVQVLKEWLRQQIGTHVSMNDDKRLEKSLIAARIILGSEPIEVVDSPNVSGNWEDSKIDAVAERLGCRITVSADVRRAARAPYFNNKSRMFYVMKQRNDLAHGNITFEAGGREKTLSEIKEIADAVLGYMDAIVSSFDSYISNREFLEQAR